MRTKKPLPLRSGFSINQSEEIMTNHLIHVRLPSGERGTLLMSPHLPPDASCHVAYLARLRKTTPEHQISFQPQGRTFPRQVLLWGIKIESLPVL